MMMNTRSYAKEQGELAAYTVLNNIALWTETYIERLERIGT
jgi:hypothetical protein